MKKVLKCRNVSKTFRGPNPALVLKDISLDLEAGQSVAIMGKSGEGKSTLLHILGTLEKPCAGTITICNIHTENADCSAIRNQHIGFVFQSYHLLEEETVLQNILMPAKIARKNVSPGSEAHKRACELIEMVGLSHRKDFICKYLSGGEKQRVAIARALCNDPDLILADEPTGSLDHTHSQAIHELLISSVKKLGKSLIIVTHDRELASLCDRTLLLKDGMLCNCLSSEPVM